MLLTAPTVVACLAAGAVLVPGVIRVYRSERRPAIASARLGDTPLTIDLPQSGTIAAYAVTPRGAFDFRNVRVELRGAHGAVPGGCSWLRGRANGWRLGSAPLRIKLWLFEVPSPGRYELLLAGLSAAALDDDETQILLAPAPTDAEWLGAFVPRIVGLVLVAIVGGASLVGSLILGAGWLRPPRAPDIARVSGTARNATDPTDATVREPTLAELFQLVRTVPAVGVARFVSLDRTIIDLEIVNAWHGDLPLPGERVRVGRGAGWIGPDAEPGGVVLVMLESGPDDPRDAGSARTLVAALALRDDGAVLVGPGGTEYAVPLDSLESLAQAR